MKSRHGLLAAAALLLIAVGVRADDGARIGPSTARLETHIAALQDAGWPGAAGLHAVSAPLVPAMGRNVGAKQATLEELALFVMSVGTQVDLTQPLLSYLNWPKEPARGYQATIQKTADFGYAIVVRRRSDGSRYDVQFVESKAKVSSLYYVTSEKGNLERVVYKDKNAAPVDYPLQQHQAQYAKHVAMWKSWMENYNRNAVGQ